MKRVLFIALCFLLLGGLVACKKPPETSAPSTDDTQHAVATAAPAKPSEAELDTKYGFVEQSDAVRYVDSKGNGCDIRALIGLDQNGYVDSVVEKYRFGDGVDAAKAVAKVDFGVDGVCNTEGNLAYFIWSPEAIDEQFGMLYPEEIQEALDTWAEEEQAPEEPLVESPVHAVVLKKDGLIFTVETLRYRIGQEISYDLRVENTGTQTVGFCAIETYLNDWCVYNDRYETTLVAPGEVYTETMPIFGVQRSAFKAMQIREVQTLRFLFDLYDASGSYQSSVVSETATNPLASPDYVQVFDDSGTVLLDDDTAKVVQRRFDGTGRRAQIYIEKKDTSRWSHVNIEPVYNGYRSFSALRYDLQRGARAIVELDGTEICDFAGIKTLSAVDLYLVYYHSERLKDPIHLTLVNPKGVETEAQQKPVSKNPVVFEGKYCTIRFAGRDDEYFSRRDVLLLECENTSDKNLSVYQMFNYMLLDGERVDVWMNGANVYPHSTSFMALYSLAEEGADLSRVKEAQLTLGVYEIHSGYHNEVERTGVLTLPLQ